ncbi:MAG: MBL fold metallo-hydrolase [Geitlerinemataceae cyanobacterium]
MQLTYLDSNTWLFNFNGTNILLDPWLVGPLVFANQGWFFKGDRTKPKAIPDKIDAILLSQGLPDHAHPPTLEKLDRAIPVIGSPNAIGVVRDLGYTNLTSLEHGDRTTFVDITIEAVPGSPIGPTLMENAYFVRSAAGSFYYEPHGFHHRPSLEAAEPVDAAIVPVVGLNLPVVGAFIKGEEAALEVAQLLRPRFVIPTTTRGDVEFTGVLEKLLGVSGTEGEFQQALSERCPEVRSLLPTPGEPFELSAVAG